MFECLTFVIVRVIADKIERLCGNHWLIEVFGYHTGSKILIVINVQKENKVHIQLELVCLVFSTPLMNKHG